jgi:phage shock protein C
MRSIKLAWVGTRTGNADPTVAFFRDVLGLPLELDRPGFWMLKLPDGRVRGRRQRERLGALPRPGRQHLRAHPRPGCRPTARNGSTTTLRYGGSCPSDQDRGGTDLDPTRKLYRSRSDRKLAGVCGGLASFFNLDPTLIRVLFVVLAVLGGSGILIYLAMWIMVPNEPTVVA